MVDNKQETPMDMREILASGESVPVYRLYQLSDMSSEDLDKFAAIWQDLDDERRRIVIRHMADLSEGDYQVEYCEVFEYLMEIVVDYRSDTRIRAQWPIF
jgi:hypothetical protein